MKKSILNHLDNNNNDEGVKSSKLRKLVIAEISPDSSNDKEMKLLFTSALEELEKKGKVIDDNGIIKLIDKKRKQNDNDENKNKKEKRIKYESSNENNNNNNDDDNNDDDEKDTKSATRGIAAKDLWRTGEQAWRDGTLDADYLQNNPDNITRIFCGNLNKKITEEDLRSCLEGITYIKWITDKQTQEFYGSTFLEMKDSASAAAAVLKDRSKFMGRPLKIYYCPPRPGDVWPPTGESSSNRRPDNKKGPPIREKTNKPPGCKKLFMGNLSYNIDDDTIVDFFKDCGGDVIGLRWLTRKGTEEFRGCGFIEFSSSEAADEAIKKDGLELLGRPIRLDWDA